MPIRDGYDREAIRVVISRALSDFYGTLIQKAKKLDLNEVIKRKNPYLFRAKAMSSAPQIVSAILSAYMSSSGRDHFWKRVF